MGTTTDDSFSARTNSDQLHAFENDTVRGELPHYRFGMFGFGWAGGVVGCGGEAMTRLLGPYSTFAGVHGTARDFTGVAGTSVNKVGVYGQVEDSFGFDGLHAGVLGTAVTQPAVIGFSRDGEGVQGITAGGVGVRGHSPFSPGVFGLSAQDSGVFGVSGSLPIPAIPLLDGGAGVVGVANARAGVVGMSNVGIGVFGRSNKAAAVHGEAPAATAYAGLFNGKVRVTGVFTAAVKNAAVPFPDGTQRVLHCMESPEHWFEDFGAAKLQHGRALVKLDADFAKVIKRGDYKVFVTPEGDCRGLCVRRKRAASFEVRELMGGTSSITFSYRIVGRRKDIRGHRRFAKTDPLPTPAPRARRPSITARAFIADLQKRARAKATPAMRKSDRRVAALPPPDVQPRHTSALQRDPAEKRRR